jgi:hypothetical protein
MLALADNVLDISNLSETNLNSTMFLPAGTTTERKAKFVLYISVSVPLMYAFQLTG